MFLGQENGRENVAAASKAETQRRLDPSVLVAPRRHMRDDVATLTMSDGRPSPTMLEGGSYCSAWDQRWWIEEKHVWVAVAQPGMSTNPVLFFLKMLPDCPFPTCVYDAAAQDSPAGSLWWPPCRGALALARLHLRPPSGQTSQHAQTGPIAVSAVG